MCLEVKIYNQKLINFICSVLKDGFPGKILKIVNPYECTTSSFQIDWLLQRASRKC